VFDVQQKMLDDVTRRAVEAGVGNIAAKRGDARRLPYPDASFDGAYLIGVLGEIPDEDAALRELRRVLRPNGRLVVGEIAFDPDFVPFGSLRDRAAQAGFTFERKLGNSFSYLARFRTVAILPNGV
jgi:ubiquinone/menaquinone biosynthesis C-methylase UbiE